MRDSSLGQASLHTNRSNLDEYYTYTYTMTPLFSYFSSMTNGEVNALSHMLLQCSSWPH